MPPRLLVLRLQDIIKAINQINKHLEGHTLETFLKDEKTIDAVLYNFTILGEPAAQLPTSIRKKSKGIPWEKMIGMRNIVVHEYFRVDIEILWNTIKDDLPALIPSLKKLDSQHGVRTKSKETSQKRY